MTKYLTKEKANKVYDVLVEHAGAKEDGRDSFIYSHCTDKYGPTLEYRFCGHFGFGGKYRSSWNGISMYSEDYTPERLELKEKINKLLKEIK